MHQKQSPRILSALSGTERPSLSEADEFAQEYIKKNFGFDINEVLDTKDKQQILDIPIPDLSEQDSFTDVLMDSNMIKNKLNGKRKLCLQECKEMSREESSIKLGSKGSFNNSSVHFDSMEDG